MRRRARNADTGLSLVAHPVRHAMATPTGLEPAASAVTGRRANQLRYGASCFQVVLVKRVEL